MATINEGRNDVGTRKPTSRTGLMTLALAALVALGIGVGVGWFLAGDGGAPSDVEQLVEDYQQAWMDGDGERAVGYMTTGARFVSPRYVAIGGISGDDLVTHINTSPVEGLDFEGIDHVAGDSPYVVVSTGSYADRDGFGVLYLVEEDGELKIAHNAWHD